MPAPGTGFPVPGPAGASLGLARVGRQRWQIAEVPGVRLLGGLHELAEDDLVDGQALEGVGEGV